MGDRKMNNPKESSFSLKENTMYAEMDKAEQKLIDKMSELSSNFSDMNRNTERYQKGVQNALDALNIKSLIDFLSKGFTDGITNKIGNKIDAINKKLESNKERIKDNHASRKQKIEDKYDRAVDKLNAKKLKRDMELGFTGSKERFKNIFGSNFDEKNGTVLFNGQLINLARIEKGDNAGEIDYDGRGNEKLFTAGKKLKLAEEFDHNYRRLARAKKNELAKAEKSEANELGEADAIANTAKTANKVKGSVQMAAIKTTANIVKGFVSQVKKGFQTLGIDISNIFGDIATNIKNALSSSGIASYSMGTSLFSNSSARSTAMQYGLSSSGTYALSQTMSMLNMSSDEDLMFMNDNQRSAFSQLTNYYKQWYEKLESSGALEALQKTQLEFQIFKQEMAMKFLNWFSKNKDSIMDAINNVLTLIEAVVPIMIKISNVLVKIASGVASWFGNGSSKSVSGTDKVNIQITQNISSSSANVQDITNSNNLLARQLTKAINGM